MAKWFKEPDNSVWVKAKELRVTDRLLSQRASLLAHNVSEVVEVELVSIKPLPDILYAPGTVCMYMHDHDAEGKGLMSGVVTLTAGPTADFLIARRDCFEHYYDGACIYKYGEREFIVDDHGDWWPVDWAGLFVYTAQEVH